ncbi:MAG: bifunctional histidinol-phosphatase/imidazoleglycerol-phosphate dehydratase HisB [Bacteroides sp.]|nr:bifunctional histidinol-phosphatase/imidazoleglycerol-phosphate dehydratase HisB [Bacteroides sp.]
MKRLLIIDRDGTILVEPPIDYQIDSLDKFEFVPGVITALAGIAARNDFELVMASNQDGLGTSSFPIETFNPPHNLMLRTLEGEGIRFSDILIDPSMPEDNSPNRKPRTGMFNKYIGNPDYDLPGSYVIGDRLTDVELARNLGAQAILLQPEGTEAEGCVLITDSWQKIGEFLRASQRSAKIERVTKETSIRAEIDLDGCGPTEISTGLNFFNHMLEQIPHHSGCSLKLIAEGDLEVDEHHTMEDVAIVLGQLIAKALGNKAGIDRYGFSLPMDECAAQVLLDFGGRSEFMWNVNFTREYVGDTPTEMYKHFFKTLSSEMRCNLHISAHGENNHHLIEGVFKAFARALRMAVRRNVFSDVLPSSKGLL